MTDLTEDTLLNGRVALSQPAQGYRAAIDPVLLAAAMSAQPRETVLDAGCGVGAALFCLAARLPGLALSGLDMQADLLSLARHNGDTNGVAVTLLLGDIAAPPPALLPDSFDHIMTNPPFVAAGRGTVPPNASKALAHVETTDLTSWTLGCLRLLRQGGILTMIHRAERLGEIQAVLERRAGNLRIFPLWPKSGQPARRIIIQARKGARGALTLLPGMTLHGADGAYTPGALAILREAAALDLEA
jgi:tRNA1(Val) A37 N6-methylase TrmN6